MAPTGLALNTKALVSAITVGDRIPLVSILKTNRIRNS